MDDRNCFCCCSTLQSCRKVTLGKKVCTNGVCNTASAEARWSAELTSSWLIKLRMLSEYCFGIFWSRFPFLILSISVEMDEAKKHGFNVHICCT
jgi:hypothetical protein